MFQYMCSIYMHKIVRAEGLHFIFISLSNHALRQLLASIIFFSMLSSHIPSTSHMYVCTYVFVYDCMYKCLYMCVCICVYICLHYFVQTTKPKRAVIRVQEVDSWKQLSPLPYQTVTITHLTFLHSSHLLLATSRDQCQSLWKRNDANNRKKCACNVCKHECIIDTSQAVYTSVCHTHVHAHAHTRKRTHYIDE